MCTGKSCCKPPVAEETAALRLLTSCGTVSSVSGGSWPQRIMADIEPWRSYVTDGQSKKNPLKDREYFKFKASYSVLHYKKCNFTVMTKT